MDPRDQLLADTQRIFAEYVVPLTLEEARNARHILRLLIEWKSRAEGQTLSPASTARMQFGISPSQLLGEHGPRWRRIWYCISPFSTASAFRSTYRFRGRACISKLDTHPIRSPVAARPPPARAAPHDSGPLCFIVKNDDIRIVSEEQ
jgi:hypothetical protein